VAVVVAVLSLVFSGCGQPVVPTDLGSDTDQYRVMLDRLLVIPRPARDPTYRRAMYGPAWADTDHNGCRQRQDVLRRDLDRSQPYDVRRRGSCAHEVYAGTWIDPYTGQRRTFTDLKDAAQAWQIPIDHVVALGVAHRYGAKTWTPEQQLEFATDLDNLVPTSELVNQSKGDRDPADWRPPASGQCVYARRYIEVKSRYRLPVDDVERRALRPVLDRCS
jgi:hypothetical protein